MSRRIRVLTMLALLAWAGAGSGCAAMKIAGGIVRVGGKTIETGVTIGAKAAETGVSLGIKAAEASQRLTQRQVEHGFRAANAAIDTVDHLGQAVHRARARRLQLEQLEQSLAQAEPEPTSP